MNCTNSCDRMRILVSGVGDGGRVLHGIVIVQAADYDPRFARHGDYWRASLRTPLACSHWYPRSEFTPEQAAACLVQDYPLRLCPVLGAGRIQ